ncbi:MAG: CBS domain-containing protein [Proteobacteria bacterium]|nr:CBS domain-containing protein [Pseudomonadota bacterium]
MTHSPEMISPGATLQQAAQKMEAINCGALPVGTANKLKGIITDRDIVIRALAKGRNPATEKVANYMTDRVYACTENDTLEEAAEKMHRMQVSRLVVRDKEGKVSGILSFGESLRHDADPREIAGVIKHCCGPVVVYKEA